MGFYSDPPARTGDALQYLTDGRFKSTYHRVRLPAPGEFAGERLSLAFFANAGLHAPLQGPSGRYPAVSFADVLRRRAAEVPLPTDAATGAVLVDSLAGKAGGPDFAADVSLIPAVG